jgi:proline iminopeptidase
MIFEGAYFSSKLWDRDAHVWLEQMPEPQKSTLKNCAQNGNWEDQTCVDADDFYSGLHLNRQNPHPQIMLDALGKTNWDLYTYMNGPNEFDTSGTLKTYEVVNKLHLIRVPTLFISGRYDEVRPETSYEYARHVRRSRVKVFANSSHTSHLEETPAFLMEITRFLR